MEKCENLCGSEKIETTNDVDEYDAPSVSLNYDRMLDLNYENSFYFNSNISDCDASTFYDFNHDKIREEDSEDDEKMIQDQFLTTDECANFLNSLTKLQESFLSIDSEYEKICRTKHDGEKFIDSGISLTNGLSEDDSKITRQVNCDNSQDISEKRDVVACKTVEEDIKNQKMTLAQNDTFINIEDSLQEKLDINDASTIESSNGIINNNENYFKDDLDLSKGLEENAKCALGTEEDSIEETITVIKTMDKIIKDLLTSDDEHDSTEEGTIESLSAKMENDHDDVMRKIIESCSHTPADFQQHTSIRKIPSTDLIHRSNSECVTKKCRGNEFFPRHRAASEIAIAKEEILKTIEEAKKILTDGPCWDTSETNANRTAANYKDNSLEKSTEKVKDDEEHEKVNETINGTEIDVIENEDTEINSANTVTEKISVSESDIVESNLQKLAEITGPDRPRSRIEIQETLEKIAEEKKKIEDRKKISLKILSEKFEEIDKLIADHNTFHVSDNDSGELKTQEDVVVDSGSPDEFQVRIDPEHFQVPLTKSEITENLKIEELEKELAEEIEEHKKLMDEYQKIIATDLEKIQLTLEFDPTEACNDIDSDEEIRNDSKDDDKISEEFSNEKNFEMTNDIMAIKSDSELDEEEHFFMEEFKESEKTYIKGKVYDFDEKKHGVR